MAKLSAIDMVSAGDGVGEIIFRAIDRNPVHRENQFLVKQCLLPAQEGFKFLSARLALKVAGCNDRNEKDGFMDTRLKSVLPLRSPGEVDRVLKNAEWRAKLSTFWG
jgi:hypothetical protein